MSGIASEAGALRHSSHVGQSLRTALSAPDNADQSPFAALLDESPPPVAAQPAPLPTSQEPVARPQERPAAHIATEAQTGPQKPPSDNSPQAPQAQQTQAASAPATPPAGQKGADITTATPGALFKKVGKATDANPDTPAVASEPPVATVVVDTNAGSSDAAPADTHDDKKAKSDVSDTASTPPDASAIPQPPAPQPIAAALTLPVVAAAPASDQSESNTANSDTNAGTSAPDAAQIAALSGAIRAGTPRGKADAANEPPAPDNGANATNGTNAATTDGSAKPAAKTFDTARLIPPLTPQPSTKAPPPTAPPTAGGSQPPAPDVGAAKETAASYHARQMAAMAADPNAAPQVDSSPDPNSAVNADQGPATKLTADITRQALDVRERRPEKPAAQISTASLSNVQTGAPQAAGATGSAVAPASVTTATADTAPPTTPATAPVVPIAGLAVEIAAQARAGKSRFDIRLDPPELGRIDVRLDVDRDGKVVSRVVVDRPETLDILRRDASEIERSLQQAGLKTADNNALQFSLRDNGTSGGFGNFGGYNPYPNNGSPSGAARVIIPDRDLPPVDAGASYARASGTGSGIDIRV